MRGSKHWRLLQNLAKIHFSWIHCILNFYVRMLCVYSVAIIKKNFNKFTLSTSNKLISYNLSFDFSVLPINHFVRKIRVNKCYFDPLPVLLVMFRFFSYGNCARKHHNALKKSSYYDLLRTNPLYRTNPH